MPTFQSKSNQGNVLVRQNVKAIYAKIVPFNQNSPYNHTFIERQYQDLMPLKTFIKNVFS